MNWPDVNDPFFGRVGKTAPRQTEQTNRNQDYSKRLVHGGLLGSGGYQCEAI